MVLNQTTQTWIYSQHEVDITNIVKNMSRCVHKRGNQGTRNKPIYLNSVNTFDIETTRLKDIEQAFMYIWQVRISEYTIVGRYWGEFIELLQSIKEGLNANERFVFYIHNLSHEFQYFRGIYKFNENEVFCLDRRKIAKCEMFGAIEFRCSYIHSNMSLEQFCNKMKCKTKKLVGELDYSIVRYPWTELNDNEMAYCINDVIALQEALEIEMNLDGDNIESIPLTSTGYVRRKCKESMKKKPGFYSYIQNQTPDFTLYSALREAFRGGNTHANRFFVGDILENVHSVDRSSSYPDVLVNQKFPVRYFVNRGPITHERFIKNKDIHNRACIIRISMFDVDLKNPFEPCPYLAKDKCRNVIGAVIDNGRILKAKHIECTLTDIDYNIVESMYTWTNECIYDSFFSSYGKLPKEFINVILDMYNEKTKLKGDEEQEVYYGKIKNMINALYGMTAQNPLRISYNFANNDYYIKDIFPPYELMKYNRKAFLVYQWGVWVTAHARNELQKMIDIAGDGVKTKSAFVYADTDSVKYLGDIDIDTYNQNQIKLSTSNNGFAIDAKGNTHYLGVYEVEKNYDRFITWGAKKYAFEIDGKLFVTIAGVSKKLGGKELESKGGLEAFKPGFTFIEAGGTEAVYNDNIDMWLEIGNNKLHITDNVVIRPSTYTLGLGAEFQKLLDNIELCYDLYENILRDYQISC